MVRASATLLFFLGMSTLCYADFEPIWLIVGQSVLEEEYAINVKELKNIHQSGRVYLQNNAGYYDYDRYVLVNVRVTSPHYKDQGRHTYGKYTYKVYCDVGWSQLISGVSFNKKTGTEKTFYSPDRYATAHVPDSILETTVSKTCETSKNNPFYPELNDT